MSMRSESFFQFIKKARPPFFFTWPINIVFVAVMITVIAQGFGTNVDSAIVGSLVFTIFGFLGLKLMIYNAMYTPYSAGGRAINELKGLSMQVLASVGVYIKGFDLFSQNSLFLSKTNKTIYDFDKADLVLTDESIILMGKSYVYGGESYAYPVEIVLDKAGRTTLPKAKIIHWEQRGTGVEIQVQDNQYKNPFVISFNDNVEELKHWLTQVSK